VPGNVIDHEAVAKFLWLEDGEVPYPRARPPWRRRACSGHGHHRAGAFAEEGRRREGVETNSQLAQLRTLACDPVQGSLLARPMNAIDVEDFFEWANAAKGSKIEICAHHPRPRAVRRGWRPSHESLMVDRQLNFSHIYFTQKLFAIGMRT
jgi:hypothetical protein